MEVDGKGGAVVSLVERSFVLALALTFLPFRPSSTSPSAARFPFPFPAPCTLPLLRACSCNLQSAMGSSSVVVGAVKNARSASSSCFRIGALMGGLESCGTKLARSC